MIMKTFIRRRADPSVENGTGPDSLFSYRKRHSPSLGHHGHSTGQRFRTHKRRRFFYTKPLRLTAWATRWTPISKAAWAVIDALACNFFVHHSVSSHHHLAQFFIHAVFLPAVLLEVLGPFEIGYRNPSGVHQDIRQDDYTSSGGEVASPGG